MLKQLAIAASGPNAKNARIMNTMVGYQDMGGRITRYGLRTLEKTAGQKTGQRDAALTKRWMDAVGVDVAVLFPTPMLALGVHPQVEVEIALSRAYNRWLCERVLAHEKRLVSMLYLPFNDPDATYEFVKEFGEKKGVVGFLITSTRYRPVHANQYMKTYALLEEMGLPIAFHGSYHWHDQAQGMLNRFISVHALGFVWYNMCHLANWIINGIPERFPKLKVVWLESGLAWIPFMMQRFDNEYMMRTSEAPALKKLPSDYMRDMYFASQPMEITDMGLLEETMRVINAETQLVYSSDYPHWDFDLPSTIYDLPFLSETAKRNILGGNANRLFNLKLGAEKLAQCGVGPRRIVGARDGVVSCSGEPAAWQAAAREDRRCVGQPDLRSVLALASDAACPVGRRLLQGQDHRGLYRHQRRRRLRRLCAHARRATWASTCPAIPSLVPKNMAGGGGIRLANFLYNAAPKDGTGVRHLQPRHRVRSAARQQGWRSSTPPSSTGSAAPTTRSASASPGTPPGIRTRQQVLDRELVVGASPARRRHLSVSQDRQRRARHQIQDRHRLSRRQRHRPRDGAPGGAGPLRLVVDEREGHAPTWLPEKKIQHPVPDGAVEAPRAADDAADHGPRQDRRGARDLQADLRAAGDGLAVRRPARRAAGPRRRACARPSWRRCTTRISWPTPPRAISRSGRCPAPTIQKLVQDIYGTPPAIAQKTVAFLQ